MALKLPDSAVPMGDFPVAKAVDIDFDDGENLQDKLDNGKLGSGDGNVDLTDIENRITTLEENQLDVDITTTINNFSSNTQIPTARTVAILHNGNFLTQGVDVLQLNVGVYNISSDGIAGACTNLPSTSAGKLTIRSLHGDDGLTPYTGTYKYFIHEYRDIKGGHYVCTVVNNTSTASPDNVRVYGWYKISTSEDLTTVNTKITALEEKANLIPAVADNPTDYDLNNYKENGNYSIGTPTLYNNMPQASSGLLTVSRSNTYRVQVFTVVDQSGDNVYFRKSTNFGNSWSSWVLLNDSNRITTLETQVSELFQSVSDGKTLVANAITDKGVSTSSTDTFATMASNISKINTATVGYKSETKGGSKTTDRGDTASISIAFSNTVLGVTKVDYSWSSAHLSYRGFSISGNTVTVKIELSSSYSYATSTISCNVTANILA